MCTIILHPKLFGLSLRSNSVVNFEGIHLGLDVEAETAACLQSGLQLGAEYSVWSRLVVGKDVLMLCCCSNKTVIKCSVFRIILERLLDVQSTNSHREEEQRPSLNIVDDGRIKLQPYQIGPRNVISIRVDCISVMLFRYFLRVGI